MQSVTRIFNTSHISIVEFAVFSASAYSIQQKTPSVFLRLLPREIHCKTRFTSKTHQIKALAWRCLCGWMHILKGTRLYISGCSTINIIFGWSYDNTCLHKKARWAQKASGYALTCIKCVLDSRFVYLQDLRTMLIYPFQVFIKLLKYIWRINTLYACTYESYWLWMLGFANAITLKWGKKISTNSIQ